MDERKLITRAQSGDFEAFSRLVSENKSKVYALALKMSGNSEDAEDIVQESLLKAIDNMDTFRGESAFGTWLYAITLNQARAHLKKQRQADLKPIEEYLPGAQADADHGAMKLFDWKDPHRQLEEQELRTLIDAAIADLPYVYREAFLLRYFEEMPIKEIAELTGESVASIKSRVLRARLAVRDSLSRSFEESYAKKMP